MQMKKDAPKKDKYSWLELLIAGGLILLQVAIFYRIKVLQTIFQLPIQLWDFDIYYRLARDIVAGNNPYQVSYMTTLGPPIVIAAYLPFSFFPLTVAQAVFTSLSIVSALLSCYLLTKIVFTKYHLLGTLGLNLILWLSFPARFTFIVGQLHFLMLPLLVLLIGKSTFRTKGVTLGLLILGKTFWLMTAFSFLKKQKKVLIRTAATILIMFGGLLFWIKPWYYQEFALNRFPEIVFSQNQAKDLDYYNQSLKATLQRFSLAGAYLPIFVLSIVIISAYLIWSENIQAGITASIMLSPVVWQHYSVLLFPVLIWIFPRCWKKIQLRYLWYLSFGLWFVEFPWLHTQSISWWTRILASHYFLSTCLLLVLTVVTHPTFKSMIPSLDRRTRFS